MGPAERHITKREDARPSVPAISDGIAGHGQRAADTRAWLRFVKPRRKLVVMCVCMRAPQRCRIEFHRRWARDWGYAHGTCQSGAHERFGATHPIGQAIELASAKPRAVAKDGRHRNIGTIRAAGA